MRYWTTIDHDIRRKFDLSLNEYAIADRISCLSFQKGWCDASKDVLGDFIGIKKRSVFKILNKLIEKGLVVREEHRLKVTDLWRIEYGRSRFGDSADNFSRNVSIMEKDNTMGKEKRVFGPKIDHYKNCNGRPEARIKGGPSISKKTAKAVLANIEEMQRFASGEYDAEILELGEFECIPCNLNKFRNNNIGGRMKKVNLKLESKIEHEPKIDYFSNFKGKPTVKFKGNFSRGGCFLSKNKVKAVLDHIEVMQKFAAGEYDAEILELAEDEVLRP